MKKVAKKFSAFIAMTMMLVMMVAMSVSAHGEIFRVNCNTGVPTPVNCVRYSTSVINNDGENPVKPTLTLYKYNYLGDGNTADGQYPGNIPEGATPLANVVFTYLKVADLVHNYDEAGSTISLQYDVTDAEIAELLGVTTGLHTSEELINALNAANENADTKKALETAVNAKGTDMDETDENGMAHVSDLDMGLYLIIESSVPGEVFERVNPFFVSLPMTNVAEVTDSDRNVTYEPGTLWQYDVFVYPKNKVDTPEIEKNIIDNNTGEREKYESVGVGDTVTYEVKSEVPLGVDNMSKYNVLDTMSQGLTFTGVTRVRVGNIELSLDTVPVSEDVTIDDHTYTFMIEFIKDGTNLLAGHAGEDITITYTAVLNENCVVTAEGNPNHATLIYNHNAGVETSDNDMVVEDIVDPVVYTYGIDLTKVNSSNVGLAGIEFELYAADKETKINVAQKSKPEGEVDSAYVDMENSYYPVANGTATITTDAEGRAYIWGLAPGTYYLKETKTVDGNTLQKDLIEVKIGEEVTYQAATTQLRGTYAPIPNGNVPTYYRLRSNGEYVQFRDLSDYAGKNVNFGSDAIYTMNEDGTYEKVAMFYPVVKADIETAEPFNASGMNVLLTVLNTSDFDLPATGGIGTYIFTIGGAIIILAALGLILVRRRKNLAR